MNIGKRLEAYTIKHPFEVLIVTVETGGETDEIIVFKGFSSSVQQPTNPDPEIPVIADEAVVIGIERVKSPYDPSQPNYLQRGLSREEMEQLLEEEGI
jgi:hypothetical protein